MDRTNDTAAPIKKYTPLIRGLLFWFLLLSLLPLTVVSWFSYQQASVSLKKAAKESLEQSSHLNASFIQNWFEYRLMDIKVQSELGSNILLLESLSKGFKESGQPLAKYVKSKDWLERTDSKHNNLLTLNRRYDYIYDIFLIDAEGNILFSVAKESDFGTNLLSGVYSNTLFSNSIKKTLDTGQAVFSDLEHYESSHKALAGFISAPILNESAEKLGVIAIQLRIDRILDLFRNSHNETTSLTHYLVGEDGLLRTSLYGSESEILIKKIETRQFRRWQEEHAEGVDDNADKEELASTYIGPNNMAVIGLHQTLKLPGITWALISEIDEKDALASADALSELTAMMELLTFCIVVVLAVYLSRRISRPITLLAEASEKIAAGETYKQVEITSKNEIGRLAESFNDMLESRQGYEQALKRSTEDAQHALVELAEQKYALDQHAIVAITDIGGTITFVNYKFTEISGYSSEELIGQNHRMLNSGHHSKEFFERMYQTISNGLVWHGEICNRSKNGRHYWVDTTIVPFMDDNNKPKSYVAIRADITERKKAEAQLTDAKELAEAAVTAKGEFLASMSHEIRTPMNGILGMLRLLQNTDLNDIQKHRVSVAQSSASSLLNLINDILDFSKVEAGKLEIEKIDFDLRGMMGDFSEALGYQAQEKGLELILDVSGINYSKVKGDPGRIRQILTNLVGNAVKFTDEGEVVVRAMLQSDKENKLCFECSICDTGIGIALDKQKYLFESFNQVDASTTRKYGGTGLGLSIAKKLCELMGGNLNLKSEEGKGSCFNIKLYFEESEQSQQVVPMFDIGSLKLLVVDDNATNREVLRTQLECWGASVDEASNGPDALELCSARSKQAAQPFYDIAFLDMQMPGMDGEALSKKIKEDKRFKSMKLVMMTSMGFQGEARYFADLGFSAYFPKPATTSDLFDALTVVAEDGEALTHADPLVTRHYLKMLKNEQTAVEAADIQWPDNTRVLLVEDNQVNQIVALSTLEALGVSADVAGNGIEALQALKSAPIDAPYTLVFMDCQMPEMDGFEASEEIRAGNAGEKNTLIPIVALTANAMKEDKDRCLAAGMSDYLSKPFEEEQLKEKMLKWLVKDKAVIRNGYTLE